MTLKIQLLLFSLLISCCVIGQTDTTNKVPLDTEEIFVEADQMPEYPGGNAALLDFISKNIVYPAQAKEAKVIGTVYVTVVINKEGKLTQPKVLAGMGSNFDEEALRVANLIPAWNPGKQNGKLVSVRYTIPFNFKIPDKGSTSNYSSNEEYSILLVDSVRNKKEILTENSKVKFRLNKAYIVGKGYILDGWGELI